MDPSLLAKASLDNARSRSIDASLYAESFRARARSIDAGVYARSRIDASLFAEASLDAQLLAALNARARIRNEMIANLRMQSLRPLGESAAAGRMSFLGAGGARDFMPTGGNGSMEHGRGG
jgi:hypothetical protein